MKIVPPLLVMEEHKSNLAKTVRKIKIKEQIN